METLPLDNLNEQESLKAQCSQWETSTDGGSVVGDSTPVNKLTQNGIHQRRPVVTGGEEVEDSLSRLNDLVNPFNSVKRYLIRNKYISEKTQSNENETTQKLLTVVEEFSQNFYYAFIAQAVLKLGKGITNNRNVISIIEKLFRRNNLSL
mmetsp:Transcript_18827/g.21029  ORF Transcript_18827/g.21029 Transcript_18827/m.21029 type:complete len:150 (+) Transcript_18827:2-451(+)